MKYHLAQVNVAKLKKPMDHPDTKGFVDQLDEMNALAENSKGFVWRLKDEEEINATNLSPFKDPKIIVNMSVWETVEDLKNYTYSSAHRKPLRDRKAWFSRYDGPYLALWWIAVGTIPDVEDAKRRLFSIDFKGPNEYAFNFKKVFPPNEKNLI